MNPQNGEILAEASYPNYDLNHPRDLTKYYTKAQLKKMTDKEKLNILNDLWNNYCVSNTYEPGSTFKPFTISAGLELGDLTGNENYVCGGVLHVGDHDIHCSNRSGHGPETLKQALENSCNVALMQIGASIGTEEFCRYQRLFGFENIQESIFRERERRADCCIHRRLWIRPVWRQMHLGRILMLQ